METRRVKTGCLPCRRRRRKCDENKPKCVNCTKRGATCQYPDFKSLSLRRDPSPEADRSLTRSQSTSSAITQCGDHGSEIHTQRSLRSPDAFAYNATVLSDHEPDGHNGDSELPSTSRPDRHPSTGYRDDQFGQVNASGTHTNFHSLPVAWNTPADMTAGPASVTNDTCEESHNMSVVSSERPEGSSPLRSFTTGSVLHVATREDIQLLLHFRYCLAPWLDVNDPNAFFGVELLSAARDSSAVMATVLELAAIHKSVMSSSDNVDHAPKNSQYHIHNVQGLLPREALSMQRKCRLLLKVGECFGLPLRDWRRLAFESNEYLGISHNAVAEPLFLWFFRIDIAAAIVAQQPLLLDPHIWNSWRLSNQSVLNGGKRHVSFFYILAECILLTSEEQHIFSPSPTDTLIPRRVFSTRWLSLWNECQLWYQTRSPEMCQVFSCRSVDAGIIDPSSTALFPIEIFSSPLALVQNVAYHIASFLLLAKKPRLVQLQTPSRRASSNAWHMHSIAGICERNDFVEQWDPVLIAGLLLIAPSITHDSQQGVLLRCLRRASHATGLNLSDEIMKLESCWQA